MKGLSLSGKDSYLSIDIFNFINSKYINNYINLQKNQSEICAEFSLSHSDDVPIDSVPCFTVIEDGQGISKSCLQNGSSQRRKDSVDWALRVHRSS